MLPDDPRHGTNAGYIAHAFSDRDYCQPCRIAHVRKRKATSLNHLRGQYARVDGTGTVRRVQALLALGHTHPEIAAASGGARNISKNVILNRYGHVHVDVVEAIKRAYEQLSMTVPTHWRNQECARRAKKLGYLPPLFWDDDLIDDPDYQPHRNHRPIISPKDIDPVVVDRLLTGARLQATRAEKDEAMRRWKAMGRSERSLCETHGWKDSRYGRSVA